MNNIISLQFADFLSVSADSLVEIKDVNVSKELNRKDRIKEFVRQIKNPFCYRCGDFVVSTKFTKNGLSFEDCLQGIVENSK